FAHLRLVAVERRRHPHAGDEVAMVDRLDFRPEPAGRRVRFGLAETSHAADQSPSTREVILPGRAGGVNPVRRCRSVLPGSVLEDPRTWHFARMRRGRPGSCRAGTSKKGCVVRVGQRCKARTSWMRSWK